MKSNPIIESRRSFLQRCHLLIKTPKSSHLLIKTPKSSYFLSSSYFILIFKKSRKKRRGSRERRREDHPSLLPPIYSLYPSLFTLPLTPFPLLGFQVAASPPCDGSRQHVGPNAPFLRHGWLPMWGINPLSFWDPLKKERM